MLRRFSVVCWFTEGAGGTVPQQVHGESTCAEVEEGGGGGRRRRGEGEREKTNEEEEGKGAGKGKGENSGGGRIFKKKTTCTL